MAMKANLVVDQGSTFSTTFNLTNDDGEPLDLTGFTAASQMRKWYTSLNATATFLAEVNAAAGTITLTLNATQTDAIKSGRYVYDVELSDGNVNNNSRVVEGIVTVTPQATR